MAKQSVSSILKLFTGTRLIVIAACLLSCAAGVRAGAITCKYLPGAGEVNDCTDVLPCYGVGFCARFECTGIGGCGPNCGQVCVSGGCSVVSSCGWSCG